MAGFFERLRLVFSAKADKALDRYEDPRETLDYSYQKQPELLQKVRRGVADVATSRKRRTAGEPAQRRDAEADLVGSGRSRSAARTSPARR